MKSGQCDGLGDAAYPGRGVNQHCAFNDIRLLWQDGSYAYNPPDSSFPAAGWVGQGGDTYIIRGSISAGSAPYRVGWETQDGSGCAPAMYAKYGDACYRGWRGNQFSGPPTPPSGSAGNPTRILGENWQNCHSLNARTPLIGGNNVGSVFNVSSSYVNIQCFDISDKSDCKDRCSGKDSASTGIDLANNADHLNLTDIRVHGMQTFGIYGPNGPDSIFSYVELVGNGGGGWNADAGDGKTGLGHVDITHYVIAWNGCAEEYPIVDAQPYKKCTDQSSGGYGDGFGTPSTLTPAPGWQVHFDQGTVAYNTQDGLDELHLVGNGSTTTVTRTLAYGNMGQQVKVGGGQGTLEDSVIVGNCAAMSHAEIPGTPAPFVTFSGSWTKGSSVITGVSVQSGAPAVDMFLEALNASNYVGGQRITGSNGAPLYVTGVSGNTITLSGTIGSPTGSGAVTSKWNTGLSNFCRAGNTAVLMTVSHGTTTAIRHNTIMGAGAILMQYNCDETAGYCDSTALLDYRDNIEIGNADPSRGYPSSHYVLIGDGTYRTPAACNAAPDGHHYWADASAGLNACDNNVFLNSGSYNDHNVYFQVRNACTAFNATNPICTNPGLATITVPDFGYPDVHILNASSAAYHAGASVPDPLTDYTSAPFASRPSIGALEYGSAMTQLTGDTGVAFTPAAGSGTTPQPPTVPVVCLRTNGVTSTTCPVQRTLQ